jgi:very-short-patch-repair endonuclease
MKHYFPTRHSNSGTTENARKLRQTLTPAEHRFWFLVRNRKFLNLRFRRQHPIGKYIVDFYCHELSLIIELDGAIHDRRKMQNYDALRDRVLEDTGLTILRFRNEDVFYNMAKIEEEVKELMELKKKGAAEVDLSRSV